MFKYSVFLSLTKNLTHELIQMLTPFMDPPTRNTDLTIDAKVIFINLYTVGKPFSTHSLTYRMF